jgi:hypothetical protein
MQINTTWHVDIFTLSTCKTLTCPILEAAAAIHLDVNYSVESQEIGQDSTKKRYFDIISRSAQTNYRISIPNPIPELQSHGYYLSPLYAE